MAAIDVEEVLAKLSTTEKVDLLSGIHYWYTKAIPHFGVTSIRLTNGPNGAGGTRNFNGVPATCFPCGTAMGITFNQALLGEAGELTGQGTIAKGAHVLSRPCINMHGSPLVGRGFESLSEGPVFAGLGAAAPIKGIKGIEGTGVAACTSSSYEMIRNIS